MDPSKVKVKIDGKEYRILAENEEVKTRDIASYVDRVIQEQKRSNPKLNQNMAYILSLMTITAQLFSSKEDYDSLIKKSKEPEEKISQLNDQIAQLEEEKEGLSSNLENLKDDFLSSLNKISELKKNYEDLEKTQEKKDQELEKRGQELKRLSGNLKDLQEQLADLAKVHQETRKNNGGR